MHHDVTLRAPTANYHLLAACNMSCGFCFATFQDIPGLSRSNREDDAFATVDALCMAGFRKINFAGGEPTLLPWLPQLIQRAHSQGVTTSIVTNGSRISGDWLDSLDGSLDIAALSIDSVAVETQRKIGRVEKGRGKEPLSEAHYLDLGEMIRAHGIRLKVNTVVNRYNCAEDLRPFILAIRPERWKIFQALPVEGQNDARIAEMTVTHDEFRWYVKRNRTVEDSGIRVVPENNELMTGSYVMVDPLGRFFDNTKGRHTYSRPIFKVGVAEALNDVVVHVGRFQERGGLY